MSVQVAQRRSLAPHIVAPELPNLTQVQTDSYEWFLRDGIAELLEEINPIQDFTEKQLTLEFREYSFEAPLMTPEQAKDKNQTYRAQLKVRAVLTNHVSGEVKEADVYLGEFPLMTKQGTFIVGGVERVVVSQIVRSYGVLFTNEQASGGRKLFGAKLIPNRGAWLEFETSARDLITVKVDRKRRIPVTTLLRAFGFSSNEEILELFKDVDTNEEHPYIQATLDKDPASNQIEGFVETYKRIRPGDLATPENAQSFVESLFLSRKRYDLGAVGRYKLNKRLGLTVPNEKENWILSASDLVEVIKEVIRLNNDAKAEADDVDALHNRRVRAVGELVKDRVRVGMVRLERNIRDRMSVCDLETVTPAQLVNSRPVTAALQEFFASSQLSQFMEQTNLISELENKRRLTATGAGGLSRERAGFEVRDVHTSHYGRMCPIETPEGANIGLVQYLASYARVNPYGFIETPYRKVVDGKVTSEIVYLDASEEEKYVIAPASIRTNADGSFAVESAAMRRYGKPAVAATSEAHYADISPRQAFSITTNLIPGLEQDDANRASMGSNMQRQAVPTVRPESPVVGTGIESDAAQQSGRLILSDTDGTVTFADGEKVVVQDSKKVSHEYALEKFIRSNQGTVVTQRPCVVAGDKVVAGQPLADSASSEKGELALGQNVRVAFMSWGGYNYEDAVIISDRLVHQDRYTSIHIEKYVLDVRDTKLGPEQVTRDIPNVSEEALANLDETGVIRIGAEVQSGSILVGKISPKGETELTAEEKLLRAVFGEKAKDVRDTSMRLPNGEKGKVIGIKIFRKDAGDDLPTGVFESVEVTVAQLRKITVGDKLAGRHGNKGVISVVVPVEDMPFTADGQPVDMILNPLGVIGRMNLGQIMETTLGWAAFAKGEKVAVPVFTGLTEEQLTTELKEANLPTDGKAVLFDGRTGEQYENAVTIGIKYMLKLSHMVDDKIHARSVGPYSMITQQPLGGRAQRGGQRFGEMEVWALEAYGAAYTLQEMLTLKSDDTYGRAKAYESIISGQPIEAPSVPESFNVLVRELQGLGLEVKLITDSGEEMELIERPAEAPTMHVGEVGEQVIDERDASADGMHVEGDDASAATEIDFDGDGDEEADFDEEAIDLDAEENQD